MTKVDGGVPIWDPRVLRMTDGDHQWAVRHIQEGSWAVGLREDDLPHFQQDYAHLRFCEEMF